MIGQLHLVDCGNTLNIYVLYHSILNGCTDGSCDRFLLSIPYCGSYIKCKERSTDQTDNVCT